MIIREKDRIAVSLLTELDYCSYISFIEKCPLSLVQHSLEWRKFILELPNQEDIYLIAREAGHVVGVLPAFVYHCDLGNIVESTPLAGVYGGIVCHSDHPRCGQVFHSLLAGLIDVAREKNGILTTICTPPFFCDDVDLYKKYFQPDFVKESFYQYLNLQTDPVSELPAKRKSAIKRGINKARRQLTISCEDTDERFEQWYDIYSQRFADIGATCVNREFFDKARYSLFPCDRGRFYYAFCDGHLIGGTILVYNHHVVDYMASAFLTSSMKYNPGNYIIDTALTWARGRGIKYFNWKASPSRDSGVYQYKARWGSTEGRYHYLTKITGDVDSLRRTPLHTLKKKYGGHYLMPYEEFTGNN